jgi:hypothetical protein
MKARVKIGLSGQSVPEVIVTAVTIKQKMTLNANFPDPPVTMANFDLQIEQLILRQTEVQDIGGKDNTVRRDLQLDIVVTTINRLGAYVDYVADGDEVIILSSGFEMVSEPHAVGTLPPPAGLKPTVPGLAIATVLLRHESVPKKKSYQYQYRLVVAGQLPNEGWSEIESGSKLSYTFTGLVSGSLYEFRVRTLSSAGTGDWSLSVSYRPQ